MFCVSTDHPCSACWHKKYKSHNVILSTSSSVAVAVPKTPPTKHLCTAPYLILPGLPLSPPTQPNPESTQPFPASLGRRAAKLQTWWLLQSSTSLGAISITCGWHGSCWSKPTHVNSCLYRAIDLVGNPPSARHAKVAPCSTKLYGGVGKFSCFLLRTRFAAMVARLF